MPGATGSRPPACPRSGRRWRRAAGLGAAVGHRFPREALGAEGPDRGRDDLLAAPPVRRAAAEVERHIEEIEVVEQPHAAVENVGRPDRRASPLTANSSTPG